MQRPSNKELGMGDHFFGAERKPTLSQRLKKIGSNIVDWVAKPASTIKINVVGSGYDADVDISELVELHKRNPETHRTDELDFTREQPTQSLSDRIRQASEEVHEE